MRKADNSEASLPSAGCTPCAHGELAGYKKLENYIAKLRDEIRRRRAKKADGKIADDEDDAAAIEKVRLDDQLASYKTIERIIAEQDAPGNVDVEHEHREIFHLEYVKAGRDVNGPALLQSSISASGVVFHIPT